MAHEDDARRNRGVTCVCGWDGVHGQMVWDPDRRKLVCPYCGGVGDAAVNWSAARDNIPNTAYPYRIGPTDKSFMTGPYAGAWAQANLHDGVMGGIEPAQLPLDTAIRAATSIDKSMKPAKDMRVRTFEEKEAEREKLRAAVAKEMGWSK